MGHSFLQSPNLFCFSVLGNRCRTNRNKVLVQCSKPAYSKHQITCHDRRRYCSFGMGSSKNRKLPKLLACMRFQTGKAKPPVGENNFRFSFWRSKNTGGGVSEPLTCPGNLPASFTSLTIQTIMCTAPFFLVIRNDQYTLKYNGRNRKSMPTFDTSEISFP